MGLCFSTYIVAMFMDFLSIGIYSIFGIPSGLGAAEAMLKLWPGGNVIAMIFFGTISSPLAIIKSLISLVLLILIKGLCPPLRKLFAFKSLRIIKYGLMDSIITILVSGIIALVYEGIDTMFFTGRLGGIIGGTIIFSLVIGVLIFLIIKLGRKMEVFPILLNFGKYLVATFALMVWSMNGIVGVFTVVLCTAACGLLVMVEYNIKGFWDW